VTPRTVLIAKISSQIRLLSGSAIALREATSWLDASLLGNEIPVNLESRPLRPIYLESSLEPQSKKPRAPILENSEARRQGSLVASEIKKCRHNPRFEFTGRDSLNLDNIQVSS
jgi:hypothetical protein